jgi:glycosyltransferase involved in cell wall biosynthesis
VRAAAARAGCLVVVSRALMQRAAELGFDVSKSQVIYNGVDSQKFSPRSRAECRKTLGLPPTSKLVVFVGNLKVSKGCVDLLAAAPAVLQAHPDTKFCFVGSGPAERELRKLARRLSVAGNLILAGRQAHDRVVDWMGASDVVTLPSHAEGVPNVLLEAMACGRPVVATAVGGIPEIVGPISGRLVPPREPVALANALAATLCASWSESRIRQSVMQFTWQQSGRSLAQVIDTAVLNYEQ